MPGLIKRTRIDGRVQYLHSVPGDTIFADVWTWVPRTRSTPFGKLVARILSETIAAHGLSEAPGAVYSWEEITKEEATRIDSTWPARAPPAEQ